MWQTNNVQTLNSLILQYSSVNMSKSVDFIANAIQREISTSSRRPSAVFEQLVTMEILEEVPDIYSSTFRAETLRTALKTSSRRIRRFDSSDEYRTFTKRLYKVQTFPTLVKIDRGPVKMETLVELSKPHWANYRGKSVARSLTQLRRLSADEYSALVRPSE